MSALTVAGVGLRRLLRDRTALFFIVVLPIVIIVVVGAVAVGGSRVRVGVVDADSGPLATELTASLGRSPALDVLHYSDAATLSTAVRRAEVVTGVIVPQNYDAALRNGSGAEITLLAEPASSDQQAARNAIQAVVAAQAGIVQAGAFAADQSGTGFSTGLLGANALAGRIPTATVRMVTVGSSNILPGGFDYSAPTELVLFVFINALAGAAVIVESRQLGVHTRMLEAVPPRTIVAGEVLCSLAICLLQSGLIVVVGSVAFGVSWGSPLAAIVLILVWALVGAGAGMLSASLFRTPEQASAIGPSVGIVLGMLGGCMWPLAIVPPAMRTLGHLVPHAWAVDAFVKLTSRHGGLQTIASDLAVLAGFAAVLLLVATLRLGRRLAR